MTDTTAVQDETLSALDQAFAERNFTEAETHLIELEAAYGFPTTAPSDTTGGDDQTQVIGQRTQATTVSALRDTDAVTDGRDAAMLDAFRMTHATTEYTRSLIVFTGGIIIENHDELAASDDLTNLITVVRNGIADLRDAEATLASQTDDTEAITQDAATPPALTVSATANTTPIAVDDTTSATITVANSGDEAATDVTVTVTTPSGMNTPDDDIEVSRIAGGDDITREVILRGTAPGIQAVNIEAQTADAVTTARTLLTIFVTDTTNEDGSQDNSDTDTTNKDGSQDTQETDDDSGPGFTVGGAVTALTGAAYAVYRLFPVTEPTTNDDTE